MRIVDFARQTDQSLFVDVLVIISHVLGRKKEEILVNPEMLLSEDEVFRIEAHVKERLNGRPLAYITNKKEFFSEEFFVDEHVLVPRPETEILIEEALKMRDNNLDSSFVLDMGCGSGAIGIIYAMKTGARTCMVDISEEALRVTRKNAAKFDVTDKTYFFCSNLFGAIRPTPTFDIVFANLPYVSEEEWNCLMIDVRDYEPKTALYGGKDGMDIIKQFLWTLPSYLKRGGCVFMETGGPKQVAETIKIMTQKGLKGFSRRDLSGTERIVIGTWTNLS